MRVFHFWEYDFLIESGKTKTPRRRTGRGVFASGELQARQNHELVAPSLRPALVVAGRCASRLLFTVADDLNSRRIATAVRQITVDDNRAPLTQLHVVFI